MGSCGSKKDPKDRAITGALKKAKADDQRKLKLLLLGAGESGKTTLFKQMKLLYSKQKGFRPEEIQGFRKDVYRNLISDIKTLSKEVENGEKWGSDASREAALEIAKVPRHAEINGELAELLARVWGDAGIQDAWNNRGELQVLDSLAYFMSPHSLERVGSKDYIPTEADILRTRVRTAGVTNETFYAFDTIIEVIDVGGQRNERRKWIEAFDKVTGIIYIVAISEYNQVLFEDTRMNRQEESLKVFRETVNREAWQKAAVILFLNKTDLFRQKLPKIPFTITEGPKARNVDFPGPHCDPNKEYKIDGTDESFEECYNAACNYLQYLYENQKPPDRDGGIYPRLTNSTDTKTVEHVMTSCKDIVLRGNLLKSGWL